MIPQEAKEATKAVLSDLPPGSYVYFIVRDGKCVYVGETVNLRNRIQSHPHHRKMDSVYFLHVPPEVRITTETEWIARLSPVFNVNAGGHGRVPSHKEGRTEAIGVTVPHILINKARRYGKTKRLNLSQVVTEALRRLL